MKVNLGRGFGPFDFDENGKLFPIFPENLPYIDDFNGEADEYTVYVDEDLVEAVCNAGLDFEEFLSEDVEGRTLMLEDAGVDPNLFDLDFDREVRERLEEEGYFDDPEDEDLEDEEFEDEEFEDENFDDEDFDEGDEDDEDYPDEGDEDDEDYPDDGEDSPPPDKFFGGL